MSTDEQLTRRCAEVMGYDLKASSWIVAPVGHLMYYTADAGSTAPDPDGVYAPLHDTDQAMELAAHLDMSMGYLEEAAHAVNDIKRGMARYADHNGNRAAAMRRAIVECACG